MRKQELIHLHGLLMELEGEIEDDMEVDLSEYEQRCIRPTSIHKSKGDHKEAVLTLSEALATAVTADDIDRIAIAAE